MSIEKLLNDGDEIISEAASLVTETKMAYEKQEITEEQYNELINDALEIEKFNELAGDLDRKNNVTKAFEFLLEYTGVILR